MGQRDSRESKVPVKSAHGIGFSSFTGIDHVFHLEFTCLKRRTMLVTRGDVLELKASARSTVHLQSSAPR